MVPLSAEANAHSIKTLSFLENVSENVSTPILVSTAFKLLNIENPILLVKALYELFIKQKFQFYFE